MTHLAFDLDQAAQRVNCSVKHLRRQIDAHKLTARRSGRKIIVEETELQRWLTSLPTAREPIAA